MEHILDREYEGEGESRVITPRCSCGWRGVGCAAYNDYQHYMVADQEMEHLRREREKTPTPPRNGG